MSPAVQTTQRSNSKVSSIKKTGGLPDLKSIRQAGVAKVKEQNQKPDDKSFTLEELKPVWDGFVQKLKDEGRDNDHATLNQDVVLKDDATIVLSVKGELQSATAERIKPELVGYLKEKLGNTQIMLETDVSKTETKRMIYTNSEKFDHLAEKYPNLNTLKSKLELDTDF